MEIATGRRNLPCCCCSIIVTTERICMFELFELFEPAPNDHDFHLYNRLEHDTRQQIVCPRKVWNSHCPWLKWNDLSVLVATFLTYTLENSAPNFY